MRLGPGRASRAAADASLDGVSLLLNHLREAGATSQVTALASRAATNVSHDDPYAVAWLLNELGEAGATAQVATLLDRHPAAHVSLDNPRNVAELMFALRQVGPPARPPPWPAVPPPTPASATQTSSAGC